MELRQNSTRNLPSWQMDIIRRFPAIYTDPSPEVMA
jgi:hypothetical protein